MQHQPKIVSPIEENNTLNFKFFLIKNRSYYDLNSVRRPHVGEFIFKRQ